MQALTWKWIRLESCPNTFVMDVPGGYVLRTVHEARQGRGPNYAEHPIPISETMVFVPCALKEPCGPPPVAEPEPGRKGPFGYHRANGHTIRSCLTYLVGSCAFDTLAEAEAFVNALKPGQADAAFPR